MKAECYIFLVNLLNVSVDNIKNGHIAKKADIESDLWLEGKNVGKLIGSFLVHHPPYLKQKIAGVLTEKGHQKSAPLIMGKSSSPKVKELVKYFDELKDLLFKRDNTDDSHKSNIETSIKTKLHEIKNVLKTSDKVSSQTFVFKTMDDMIATQHLFIELGNLLCSSYEKLNTAIENVYYNCLTLLLKRGEFDLSSLCYDQDLSKKQLELKKKVGIDYQKLLYKLLDNIFNDLEQKGLKDHQRSFIEFFLSYAYFRIPQFRSQLLSVLNNEKTTKSQIDKQNQDIESVLLDWDKDFYAHISNEEKYMLNIDLLQMALKKNWSEKFRKKGIIFFYFLIEWCDYVKKTLVVKNFSWENIAGYDVLVNTFVEQLKIRDIKKHPDVLVNASKALLANPNVLDIMLKTIITKTKLVNKPIRSKSGFNMLQTLRNVVRFIFRTKYQITAKFRSPLNYQCYPHNLQYAARFRYIECSELLV